MAEKGHHNLADSSLVAFCQPLLSKRFPLLQLSPPERQSELKTEAPDPDNNAIEEAVKLLKNVKRPIKYDSKTLNSVAGVNLMEVISELQSCCYAIVPHDM